MGRAIVQSRTAKERRGTPPLWGKQHISIGLDVGFAVGKGQDEAMHPPILTEEHLIRSAQTAVREERLGIQRGATEPRYLYDDGSVCAVGAALPATVLEKIAMDGHQKCDWLQLERAEYFGIASLRVAEALASFEIGYNHCCTEDQFARTSRIIAFCNFLLSLDPASLPDKWPSEVGFAAVFGSEDSA